VLATAIQDNKRAVVAKLLSAKGPGILQSPNRLGELPLHFCVSHGNVELTRFLLSKGADLNMKDKTGWTPLHVRTLPPLSHPFTSHKFDLTCLAWLVCAASGRSLVTLATSACATS
jgi:hypothetical protein